MAGYSVSPLLKLPAELRNQIYAYIAYESMAVIIGVPPGIRAISMSLSMVSQQTRAEFCPLVASISLSYATSITIYNENFSFCDLQHSLRELPTPASGVEQKVQLRIRLTGHLPPKNIPAFVQELQGPTIAQRILNTATIKVRLAENDMGTLQRWRVIFARLAKLYRFHHSDDEQRVWEQIYWSFGEAAEKVDGVRAKEFAQGHWKAVNWGPAFA